MRIRNGMANWIQKVSAGYYSLDKYYNGYWIDPSGEIYELEDTHHSWIYNNNDLLLEKYGIDMQSWEHHEIEMEREEQLLSLQEDLIKEIAWNNEIDESEVVLTDDQIEELFDSVSVEGPGGVMAVDYLISLGWIRLSQKNANIHFEVNEENINWDLLEMLLIKLFPKVWDNTNYHIIINNMGTYSGDLQSSGSLKSAIENSGSYKYVRR